MDNVYISKLLLRLQNDDHSNAAAVETRKGATLILSLQISDITNVLSAIQRAPFPAFNLLTSTPIHR
jgi:hypothetical protein